jgi:hypothetical protein
VPNFRELDCGMRMEWQVPMLLDLSKEGENEWIDIQKNRTLHWYDMLWGGTSARLQILIKNEKKSRNLTKSGNNPTRTSKILWNIIKIYMTFSRF